MRILHTSDLHIGKCLDAYDLKEDTQHVLNQVVDIAKAERIDAVLLSGDIFDRANPSEDAVQTYASFLHALLKGGKRKVLAIAGNHDSGVRLSAYKALFEASGTYFVQGTTTSPWKRVDLADEFGPVHFYLVPFFVPNEVRHALGLSVDAKKFDDDAAFRAMLERERIDTAQRNVILAHQFVAGYEPSGSEQGLFYNSVGGTSNISVQRFDSFDYVALGHVHRPQKLMRDTCRYSGALLAYKSSEANKGEKSVAIVEMKEKGDVSVRLSPIHPLHPMVKFSGYFEDVRKGVAHKDDYAVIELLDEKPVVEARRILSKVYPRLLSVTMPHIPSETVLDKDLSSKEEDPFSFIREYYRSVRKEDLLPEDLKLLESIFQQAEEEAA